MPLKVSGTELAFHYTEDVAAAFKSWSQTMTHMLAGNSNTSLFLNITCNYVWWFCIQNSSLKLCQPKRRHGGTTP